MKLAQRITLLFVSMFLVVIAAFAVRTAHRELGIYEKHVATDLRFAARALEPAFIEVWRVEGKERALEVLRAADTGLAGMTVRWTPSTERPLAEDSVATVRSGTDGYVKFTLPIREQGLEAGAIELSRPLDRERDVLRRVIVDKALVALVMVGVTALLALFVGRVFLGRPIAALAEQARRIGAGDLSRRVGGAERRDELGELAAEMDAMCERLERARTHVASEHAARLQAVEQLRHADRLSTVGRLAAGVAHELGTPLNVVSGRAKMIANAAAKCDAVGENATIIQAQAQRMTKLIRQLLDFARRGESTKNAVEMSDLVRATAAILDPIVRKRGVELELELPGDGVVATVDRGQIEQVLTNLVVNGVDAMSGGGKLTVRLSTGPIGPGATDERAVVGRACCRIDVIDRGSGIGPSDIEHVFDPFFTTKDVGQGTGLGLSVAFGIVEEHGGSIVAASEPGQGSRFTVCLPLAREAADAQPGAGP